MRAPLDLMVLPLLLAAAPPPVFAQAGGGLTGNLLFFVVILGIMYFVLIRPQQKQAKETQAMLAALKKGDDVVTQSGILGRIFSVDEKTVTVEVAGGVKLRMLKTAVQGKVTVEAAKDAKDAKDKGDEAKKEDK